MNYFAHGCRYIDRPYFLAGTAVPDWLSAIDRRVRFRPRALSEWLAEQPADGAPATPARELAAGILQHLHDDAWFHGTAAFFEVTGELTRRFRDLLPTDDSFRPAFLGHIVTELLLDGALIARHPERLNQYYAAFDNVDPRIVEETVNARARQSTDRLAPFIPLFVRERFLFDYVQPERLWFRLNQVLGRVTLKPLPPEAVSVLASVRDLVAERAADLLAGCESTVVSPHQGSLP